MTRSRASVADRLDQMKSIFTDLRSHVIRSSTPDDIRASTIVGARALNLFICSFSVSEHLADTELTQLNSYMIRLPTLGEDCVVVRDRVVALIDTVLSDIERFQVRFASPNTTASAISSQIDITDFDDLDADSD